MSQDLLFTFEFPDVEVVVYGQPFAGRVFQPRYAAVVREVDLSGQVWQTVYRGTLVEVQ